ncbi:MAG: hypothetical protein HRU78_06210 [Gammaproteobacteria bacterium]|nr:MAG: hypothetical protein HRU78_06210 [Gammaproteobacteria bacterium]
MSIQNLAAMPWIEYHYLPAMQNLPLLVRLKAIAIAIAIVNALLARGMGESSAV